MTKKSVGTVGDDDVHGVSLRDAPTAAPHYVLELAKSARSVCKRCNVRIDAKSVRVGIMIEGGWGLVTRWQHLDCTTFPHSIKDIAVLDGFRELNVEDRVLVNARLLASRDEVDEETRPLDPNELVRQMWDRPMEPSRDLLMPLLQYQKEGLGWMVHQELEVSTHGGILADEMGMGKTIQAIALVLGNRPDPTNSEQLRQWDEADQAHGVDKIGAMERAGTLIVLPTVALRQWQSEIARFTREGSLSVRVYHGSDRGLCAADLRDTDIVLTSYKILEMEYRKATAGTKVECRLCGKKFYPEKLRVHRKYFCGASAQRSEAQMKTTTKRQRLAQAAEPCGENSRDSEEETDAGHAGDIAQSLSGKISADSKGRPPRKVARAEAAAAAASPLVVAAADGREAHKDPPLRHTKKTRCSATVAVRRASPRKSSAKVVSYAVDSDSPNGDGTASEGSSASISSQDEDDDEEDEEKTRKRVGVAPARFESGASGKKTELRSPVRDLSDSNDENDGVTGLAGERKALPQKTLEKKGKGKEESVSSSGKRKRLSFFGRLRAEQDDAGPDSDVERDIAQAMRESGKTGKNAQYTSVLHCVSWFRVVLDEAHLIKDRSTSTARAMFNLVSLNKWCLTGTPLQNRVGELYSLIRFLRVDPHAFYFCKSKGCDCKSLHYRFTQGKCDDCGHSVMQHYCHFNKHVLNPIKKWGFVAEGRAAMLKLKQQILDEILLRRTKTSRADDIMLPPRVVRVRQERLDDKEEDFYQALYTQSQAQFNTYLEQGTVLNNYAHIFDILIRLRQAVNHPYLVIHSDAQQPKTESGLVPPASDDHAEGECGLCHEPLEQGVHARCGHWFCRSCIRDYIESVSEGASGNTAACPMCEKPLTLLLGADDDEEDVEEEKMENESSTTRCRRGSAKQVKGQAKVAVLTAPLSGRRQKSILNRVDLSRFQSSTKIEALMQELADMAAADLGAKAIVFSQFVNMLDLLEHRVQRGGLRCVKLLGSMGVDQREASLRAFREDSQVKVLLISLKAGGMALNLTVASRIFLMDPWWNPAAEMQAIDRTHRIGQHKPIFATRFIAENTIEERILRLQEKKKLVFDGTVGGDAGSMSRLTVDDMRFLFQ